MSTPFPQSIHVVFNEYGNHVPYAANLAEELRVPLIVHVSVPENIVASAGRLCSRGPETINREMSRAVEDAVRKYFASPDEACIVVLLSETTSITIPESDIFVSCDTDQHRTLHVLSPAGEKRVFRTNKGPILVPVGDGDSSIVAASRGLTLAKRLGTEIVFWHTTWRNEGEQSREARKHVSPAALAIITKVEQLAQEAGFAQSACRIECAPKVVEGITRVALQTGASLVVIPRGKRKRWGAYADRVRGRNCPIPMLILAKAPVVSPSSTTGQEGA